MNARFLIPALAGALFLSASGFAATAKAPSEPTASGKPGAHYVTLTPSQQCSLLEKKFDISIKDRSANPKAAEAKALRADAGALCTSGNKMAGIAKLEEALHDIGVASQT